MRENVPPHIVQFSAVGITLAVKVTSSRATFWVTPGPRYLSVSNMTTTVLPLTTAVADANTGMLAKFKSTRVWSFTFDITLASSQASRTLYCNLCHKTSQWYNILSPLRQKYRMSTIMCTGNGTSDWRKLSRLRTMAQERFGSEPWNERFAQCAPSWHVDAYGLRSTSPSCVRYQAYTADGILAFGPSSDSSWSPTPHTCTWT